LHHILEIPNYLSSEECDDIIRLAQEKGLETSQTMNEEMGEDVDSLEEEDQSEFFEYYDYNNDNFLDVDEVNTMHKLMCTSAIRNFLSNSKTKCNAEGMEINKQFTKQTKQSVVNESIT
jgi:hypothetical protein